MPSYINPNTGYWLPPAPSNPTTDITYTFDKITADNGGWNIRDPHGTLIFFVQLERDPLTWRVTGCIVHHGLAGENVRAQ